MNRFILSAAIVSAIALSFSFSDTNAQCKQYQTDQVSDSSGDVHRCVHKAEGATTKIKGRDIVAKGALKTINGTLVEKDTEWYLKNNSETYYLHIGNHFYREKTGIKLESGTSASVKGFVAGVDIAVVTIEVNGNVYTLRDDSGKPVWAGKGRRCNLVNN